MFGNEPNASPLIVPTSYAQINLKNGDEFDVTDGYYTQTGVNDGTPQWQ